LNSKVYSFIGHQGRGGERRGGEGRMRREEDPGVSHIPVCPL